MALLNTHTMYKKFIQHGFSEDHAEVIVEAINDQNENLATKQDLAILKTELRADMTELRADMTELRAELDTKIESINTNIKWIMAIGMVIIGILLKNSFHV